MSRRPWPIKRPLLAALVLLACAAAQAAKTPFVVFPLSGELFPILYADPREIQLGASYYRFRGNNDADAALGHSWGMTRWYSREDRWAFQWDLEAMAYSRFKLSGGVNEFQTVDFFANLPLEVRRDIYSAKAMVYHESSHLGDDYIRRTGDTGFRYSVEGVKALFSMEPGKVARFYAGAGYLLHSIPSPKRGSLQGGVELTGSEFHVFENYPWHLYLAQDLQSHENVRWNVNSNTVFGLRMGFKEVIRTMRVYIGYFTGHSPYGQFFAQREHYANVGVSFDF